MPISKTGNVPPRYCNQCGQEEHGSAGCHTGIKGSLIRYGAYFPATTYRMVGRELFRVDFVNLPPGAEPFRLKEKKG